VASARPAVPPPIMTYTKGQLRYKFNIAAWKIHTKSKLPSGIWHVFALAAGMRPSTTAENKAEMGHIGVQRLVYERIRYDDTPA